MAADCLPREALNPARTQGTSICLGLDLNLSTKYGSGPLPLPLSFFHLWSSNIAIISRLLRVHWWRLAARRSFIALWWMLYAALCSPRRTDGAGSSLPSR